jgi:DNA helicase-2/ATP-dependent DNA helicase PcrA
LQVVIDEAQDYNKLQYIIISKIFKKANFTILGDINQTINPYYKYSNLNVLEDIFKGNYIELNKSYRSSTEIIEYTNNLLNLQNISAIRKKDNNPILIKNKYSLNDDIKILLNKYKSIAVITKDEFDSEYVYDLLKKEFEITLINNKSETFSKKLVVIPSYMAKGLEFDSVIIFGKNKYKEDEKNLLYVACTRAQHELIVYE